MIRGNDSKATPSFASQNDLEKVHRSTHLDYGGDNDTSFEIEEPEDEEIVDQDTGNHGRSTSINSRQSLTNDHENKRETEQKDQTSDNKSNGLNTPTNESKLPNRHSTSAGSSIRRKSIPNHIATTTTTRAIMVNEIRPRGSDDIDVHIALPGQCNSSSSTTAVFCASIQDDISNEDLSDASCDSYTFSSTPTTADVADVSAAAALQRYNHNSSGGSGTASNSSSSGHRQSLPYHQNNHHNVPAYLGHHHHINAADDNISGSLATTTTEIDLDNTTNTPNKHSVSPNLASLRATGGGEGSSSSGGGVGARGGGTSNNGTTTSTPSHTQKPRHPATHRRVHSTVLSVPTMLLTHPSAALQDNLPLRGSTSLDLPTTSGCVGGSRRNHQRSLSAASHRSVISQHSVHTANTTLSIVEPKSRIWSSLSWICVHFQSSGIGAPSVHHAMVVIFLEFFAWGLLTMPVISVLNQTFPEHTFLMNGLVMGIKGILSFLSAPLIGALSDIWGRKFFLLITVFFTCAPIPLMTINTWWFFAMISISGIFAVTFSVVFAYVADVTTVEERSKAYGLVSATFAASLVISPALGAVLMERYSDTLVVALATAIAVLDVFFILVAVPESLPDKVRPSSWGAPINWEQADPFAALRKVGTDHTVLMQCVTVLLSYLPEAGQYSCIFVYLKLKMGFNTMEVAIFIAVVGILSISVQVTLGCFMRKIGAKRTIILGLILEMTQLCWYGFGSKKWMMWAAGILAALGSITYPAISAFVSIHSTADSQGAVQGMVTGMRGLCNGLGPAMFGVVFYLFNVDLNNEQSVANSDAQADDNWFNFPGPPFVFGGFMVVLAILVALFIPEVHGEANLHRTPNEKKHLQYEVEGGHKPTTPLMRSDSMAQL
ncbi:hippocampus abundant transcript-like protein 1 isoform X2 [Haematobia irritans]|uniref:hippocampus abundant transcript-like protein 1 isoform X2 n=1 Tax=Haematobia irritans TaxID=7368 RepID=UPI003F506592